MSEPADPDATLAAHLALLATDRPAATDRLVGWFLTRYLPLSRWLLRGAPDIRRFELSDDLLSGAGLRLCRALADPTCTPADAKHFQSLCRLMLDRQLNDLADKYTGPNGLARRYVTPSPGPAGEPADHLDRFGTSTHDPAGLVDWTHLHEQIDGLPADQRAVFEACYYGGLTQTQAADSLGWPLIRVKRLWRSALLRLRSALGVGPDGDPPPSPGATDRGE